MNETDYKIVQTENDIHLIIKDGVTEISYMDAMSDSLRESITKVTIPQSVQTIGFCAFKGFDSLKEIYIPSSVKKIDILAFSGCFSLEKADLSNTYLINIPRGIFSNCYNLQTVMLPKEVIRISDRAFSRCLNLRHIDFPKTLTEIGQEAFKECINLTEVNFPDSIESIETAAFQECAGIRKISLPPKLKNLSDKIFSECERLEDITLNENLEQISDGCFYATRLKEISIPANCNCICQFAFTRCTKLNSIVLHSAKASENVKRAFFNDFIVEYDRIVHFKASACPSFLLETSLFDFREDETLIKPRFFNSTDCEVACNFLLDPNIENFDKIKTVEVKINLAIAYNEYDRAFTEYVKTHLDRVFEIIKRENNFDVLDFMYDRNLISKQAINKWIKAIDSQEQPEIYLSLLNYKNSIKGYDRVASRFDL